MMALSGGGEDDLYFCSEDFFCDKSLNHFVVSSGVENTWFSIRERMFTEFDELAKR